MIDVVAIKFYFFFSFTVAIELIVQHIRDFLNNRRNFDLEVHPIVCTDGLAEASGTPEENCGSTSGTPKHGKKKNETHSHNMHRPH